MSPSSSQSTETVADRQGSPSRRALITGLGGFTGPHLARYLLRQGLEVVGVDCVALPRSFPNFGTDLPFFNVDLRISECVDDLIRKVRPDFVFHLAALCRSNDLNALWSNNILATDNLLRAALQHVPNVKVFIPGSAAELGLTYVDELPTTENQTLRPLSPYGISKAAQLLLAKSYYFNSRLQVYLGRTFNLMGPGEPPSMACSAMASQIAAVEKRRLPPIVLVGNTKSERDFVDIRDAVQAYWAIVNQGRSGELYNVCSGTSTSLDTILRRLLSYSTVAVDVQVDPARLRPDDVQRSVGDPSKITRETNWAPAISLDQSVRDVLDSCRSAPEQSQQL